MTERADASIAPANSLRANAPVKVLHLLDAAGGGEHLWGKEQVTLALMKAQRESGDVDPKAATFAPSLFAERAKAEGFTVFILADEPAKFTFAWGDAIAKLAPIDTPKDQKMVLHTHGYKANLFGRLLSVRKRFARHIATCHGWVTTSRALKIYNWLDRYTSAASDVVTVPDPGMIARLSPKAKRIAIPNGIADYPPPSLADRQAARAMYGLPADAFVVGSLGRLSEEKGIREYVESAELDQTGSVIWAVGGSGPLEAELKAQAPANMRWLGYVKSPEFMSAIDVFIQPSRTEGLSLSLLEAARAQKAIVATGVGATALAMRDQREALILPPLKPEALLERVMQVKANPELASRLAAQARKRFDERFTIASMHHAYRELYLGNEIASFDGSD